MAQHRRYLVTGGTSGIGRGVAGYLVAAGHRVWVVGVHADTVDACVHSGDAIGGTVADAADPEAIENAFAAAEQALGGLDGAFLNAGVDGAGLPAEQLIVDGVAEVLRVNAIGVLASAQAARRHLERPGRIVVNASINGVRPEAGFADYNASKAAAISIAQTLALEWSRDDLVVTVIAPGYVPTRMTTRYLDDPGVAADLLARIPAGRFGTVRDVGALVEFLLGPHAGYLTGAVIPVDGGRAV